MDRIDAQKTKNKLIKDKIARLKEAQKEQIEFERSKQTKEYKDIQSRLVLEAHLNRSKRIINNFQRVYDQVLLIGKELRRDKKVGFIRESSLLEIAKEFKEISQERRWMYMQQLKDPNDPSIQNSMVKQVIPYLGQKTIINGLSKLETCKAPDDQLRAFNLQYIMDNVNYYLRKFNDDFCEEISRLSNPSEQNESWAENESISDNLKILEKYKKKLQNLKAMFEVELQNKFMKGQQSSSNAQKFEKELQRQLAIKLSREEKLSLAVYQERYIQEFLKERYQVIKASNENLQHKLMGHNCIEDEISMQDLNEQKCAKTCKEVTIACNFLERLKARTDQFQSNLTTISSEVQAGLIDISNLIKQEFKLLKVVNYSNQSVQEEIKSTIYSNSRFVMNSECKAKKLTLSTQDPMFIIMKAFNKYFGYECSSGREFLINLFEKIKCFILQEKLNSSQPKLDFIEKLEELNNSMQGYETKFSKRVTSITNKLNYIHDSLESFSLREDFERAFYHLTYMMYEELPKKIPFVTDSMGKTIEFYLYKLSQMKKNNSRSKHSTHINEENYFDELLSQDDSEYSNKY